MADLIACAFCGNTGHRGAQWILKTPVREARVHKPCGDKLVAAAPKGVEVKLTPSPELKAQWRKERDERSTRAFWAEKFQKAQEAKKARERPKDEPRVAV